MSYKGIMTGKVYVSVDVDFSKVWDDLSSDEQKSVVQNNLDMLESSDLISELESRGYTVNLE